LRTIKSKNLFKNKYPPKGEWLYADHKAQHDKNHEGWGEEETPPYEHEQQAEYAEFMNGFMVEIDNFEPF